MTWLRGRGTLGADFAQPWIYGASVRARLDRKLRCNSGTAFLTGFSRVREEISILVGVSILGAENCSKGQFFENEQI